MAEQANFTASDAWFIGEDKALVFTVLDADGVAVNISTWTLEWCLRREAGADPVITKTTGSGITITNGAGGVLQVSIADTDTDDLEGGGWRHALRRTDPGNEQVLSYGDVVLLVA